MRDLEKEFCVQLQAKQISQYLFSLQFRSGVFPWQGLSVDILGSFLSL